MRFPIVFMSKKGISAVVATVLIILITVAGVAIIWVGVLPILRESLVFEELEGRVSVVGTGGYTIYDSSRGIASVQVKRDVDEGVMDRIRVNFIVGGNSVGSNVVAPDSGQTRVYNFDLSAYGTPDSVEVAPIFISSGGKEKEGSISSKVDMPMGVISDVDGVVYGLGVDVFSDVPTDGLVSMWTFSGDADDGVGGNDGTFFGDAKAEDGVLSLDGTGDYVDCGGESDNFGVGNFSISVWVKLGADVSPTDDTIISKRGVSPTYWHYRITRAGSIARLYTGHTYSSDGDVRYVDGEWHHLVMVRGAGMVSHYLDTELKRSVVDPFVDDTTSNEPIRIGTYTSAASYPFSGDLDNAMIFDRTLTEEEIVAIYETQRR